MTITAILGLFGSPLALWGLAIAAALAAFAWWTLRQRRRGREAAIADVKAATAAESERRLAELDRSRAAALRTVALLADAERERTAEIAEIDRLSAKNNSQPGLDADAVRRLNRIGRSVLLVAALGLAACGQAMRIDGNPVAELASPLALPPAALSMPCAAAVELPDGALSAGAIERLWARDRAALAACGDRHGALVRYYTARDAGLAGAPQ